MSAWWRRSVRNRLVPLGAAALVAGAVVWGVVLDDEPAQTALAPTPVERPGVHLAQALERVATESLSDWVAVADHVVQLSVTGEVRGEVPSIDDTAPDGEGLIHRELTLEVADVLWSLADVGRVAPETFTLTTGAGWIRADDGTEQEAAKAGSSRLEVGHDYVVALVWKPAQCAGDLRVPARWAIIGSGAIVPADDGVVGAGEFEGSTIAEGDAVGPPVAERFEAEDVDQIASALAGTEVGGRVQFVKDGELCR